MEEMIMFILVLVVLVLLIVFGFYIVLKHIDSIQENIYVQKTEIDNISKSLARANRNINVIKYVITTGDDSDAESE